MIGHRVASLPTFDRIRRGYDPEQVDATCRRLQDDLDVALARIADLERRLSTHQEREELLDDPGETVTNLLWTAQETVRAVVAEARQDADDVRAAAQDEAERIRERARTDAAEEARRAQQELDEQLAQRRAEVLGDLEAQETVLAERVAGLAAALQRLQSARDASLNLFRDAVGHLERLPADEVDEDELASLADVA